MPKNLMRFSMVIVVLLVTSTVLSGCGGKSSTLEAGERAEFDKFVTPDIATLDEAGFNAAITQSEKLLSMNLVEKLSHAEVDQMTAQFEAMIARLQEEIPQTKDKKTAQEKGRQLRKLMTAIGRGG